MASNYDNSSSTIRLEDPGVYCRTNNLSHKLEWTWKLTQLIQTYYETGRLKVTEDCQGFDLLLALEYFGILYQPDQLQFDSYKAYARVKEWSDYLTLRGALADDMAMFVSQQTPQPLSGMTVIPTFSVCTARRDQGGVVVSADTKQPLDWLDADARVYDFFNTCGSAKDMRDDFCMYLQNTFTDLEVRVRFPIKKVLIQYASATCQEERAILNIQVLPPTPRTKSELTYPLDELIEEDLREGKLEKLVQQVDQRNMTNPEHSDASKNSPRQVTDFPAVPHDAPSIDGDAAAVAAQQGWHVYQELEEESKHVVVRSNGSGGGQRRGRPPKQEQNDHSTLEDRQSPAPPTAAVHVIRASTDHSVTSALTGPPGWDDDGNGTHQDNAPTRQQSGLFSVQENQQPRPEEKEDSRARRKHEEWIQSGYANAGINNRVRALLDDTTTVASEAPPDFLNSGATNGATSSSFEWMTAWCTHYSFSSQLQLTASNILKEVERNTGDLFQVSKKSTPAPDKSAPASPTGAASLSPGKPSLLASTHPPPPPPPRSTPHHLDFAPADEILHDERRSVSPEPDADTYQGDSEFLYSQSDLALASELTRTISPQSLFSDRQEDQYGEPHNSPGTASKESGHRGENTVGRELPELNEVEDSTTPTHDPSIVNNTSSMSSSQETTTRLYDTTSLTKKTITSEALGKEKGRKRGVLKGLFRRRKGAA